MTDESQRHRMSAEGSLIVFNVTDADAGVYECVAENGRDRRSAKAIFTIREPPPAAAREAPAPQQSSRSPPSQEHRTTRYETRHSSSTTSAAKGDEFVLVALEEARTAVNRALDATVSTLFTGSGRNATPSELLRVFRYPPSSDREVARAAEIFERTLEIVAEKVRMGANLSAAEVFSYEDLVSASNLELIANASGCESHRVSRHVDCADVCFHAKFRSIDGTCNNWQKPLQGASLTAFRRILAPQYENGFNTPIGE